MFTKALTRGVFRGFSAVKRTEGTEARVISGKIS
jgi:F-type H+-transporting ATPase subunit beta